MKKCFTVLGVLILLISLILGGIPSANQAQAQKPEAGNKIGGMLDMQVRAKLGALEEVPLEEGQVDILQGMQAADTKVVDLNTQKVFIHFPQLPNETQIAELKAMGVILYLDSWIPPLKNHPTGFLTADMPVDKLDALAEKSYVTRLHTAETIDEPHNDLGYAKINADDVWTAGYDGSGVTIAVLDSGIDVNHNDFPTLTASYDYYHSDATIANTVTGHGTHVAGSAVGRGTQSSNLYKGTAPGANLVFLKIGSDTTGGSTTAVESNAIKAAVDTYNADVITMSYGGWGNYHDGTRESSQAVDYAVEQGAVVFISAGNEANDDHHYSGTVSASSTTGDIQVNTNVVNANTTVLLFNLVWYDGLGTNNDLELLFYDSGHNALGRVDAAQSESSRGTESEWTYYNTYVSIGSSTYYLKVQNISASDQFFHLYYSSGLNQAGAGSVVFNSPDPDYTISAPADADSAIAVGAYTTRKYWWDYKNGPNSTGWSYVSGETVDLITTFSSRGPRVDTGAPPKPNIVAPGSAIISCRDDDVLPLPPASQPATTYAPFIDNDGPNEYNATKNDGNGPADYYVMHGTSMACPIAAGVAALILEKNPTWTPAQVRHALESTATEKGDPGWDEIYGWGLIDALDAIDASMPTAASYKDSDDDQVPDTLCETFSDYETEHIVYIVSTDLLPSHNYRVVYYDGGNDKRDTQNDTSDASGNLTTHHTFVEGTDIAGTWHVIVCDQAHTPPSTYDSNWEYTLAEDTFEVEESAIPEFPTVLAAIVSLALCSGIYLWMRQKAAPVAA